MYKHTLLKWRSKLGYYPTLIFSNHILLKPCKEVEYPKGMNCKEGDSFIWVVQAKGEREMAS